MSTPFKRATLGGEITFFEFSEDAWNQLLTRPWVSQLTPVDAFPGDTLTLRGSAFTANDRVILDGTSFTPTVNLDQSISVVIPLTIARGEKSVTVRCPDGTESNRLTVTIKPQLDAFTSVLAPATSISLTGHAFENGANCGDSARRTSSTISRIARGGWSRTRVSGDK